MHSFVSRLNTLLTFFACVAAGLAFLTAVTDFLHNPNPAVDVSLDQVKKLVTFQGRQDQAIVTFNLDADLRSAFQWNTKQLFVYLQAEYRTPTHELNHVVLWDAIIQQQDQAHIRLRKHKTKYAFIDHGRGLRGAQLNLTLHWSMMPYVGAFRKQSRSFGVGAFPESYTA